MTALPTHWLFTGNPAKESIAEAFATKAATTFPAVQRKLSIEIIPA